MIELHFSDLPVPAIIFVCGAWISINQTIENGFRFIIGAFFVYLVFIVLLTLIRDEFR
jgi:hypothetical protein